MRIAGWILVIIGFGLGFALGFGRPLGEIIAGAAPDLLGSLQAGVQRNLAPWLWDGPLMWVLERPSWVAPMLLGVVLLTVSGWFRREPAPG